MAFGGKKFSMIFTHILPYKVPEVNMAQIIKNGKFLAFFNFYPKTPHIPNFRVA